MYFGRRFEVTGATLTRHIYLGGQLIAESPVTLPVGNPLRLVKASSEETILLARILTDAVASRPNLYPVVFLRVESAASLAVLLLLLFGTLAMIPGEVRLGYLGRVRRGRIAIIVIIFGAALTPLPLVEPAQAGAPPGPPGGPPLPSYPVFFVGSDHLGSTQVLTCHKQPAAVGCADRTVCRFYRYDAYGNAKAYLPNGNQVSTWQEPTDRLYTGQTWDQAAGAYYYQARFYDPKLGAFLTTDPAGQYLNPYAYVTWNPHCYVDPSGGEATASDITLAVVAVTGLAVASYAYVTGYIAVALISLSGVAGGGIASYEEGATPVTIVAGAAGGIVSGTVTGGGMGLAGRSIVGQIAATGAGGAAGSVGESYFEAAGNRGELPDPGVTAVKAMTDATFSVAGGGISKGLARELGLESIKSASDIMAILIEAGQKAALNNMTPTEDALSKIGETGSNSTKHAFGNSLLENLKGNGETAGDSSSSARGGPLGPASDYTGPNTVRTEPNSPLDALFFGL